MLPAAAFREAGGRPRGRRPTTTTSPTTIGGVVLRPNGLNIDFEAVFKITRKSDAVGAETGSGFPVTGSSEHLDPAK